MMVTGSFDFLSRNCKLIVCDKGILLLYSGYKRNHKLVPWNPKNLLLKDKFIIHGVNHMLQSSIDTKI